MIKWPSDLVNCIARRACVLYLGAGVSANSISNNKSTPPTWDIFLRNVLTHVTGSKRSIKYITSLLNQKNYLLACEVIIDRLGIDIFKRLAREAFCTPGFKPAAIHKVIYDLDSRLVITPNVDKIYEQYAVTESQGTIVVKTQTETDVSDFIKSGDRIILKAHGSIDNPNSMIFSKCQYAKARHDYSHFYRLLDALTLTYTYLFIGCGLNDPDIQLTLENYNFEFPDGKPHFFISCDNSINAHVEHSLFVNYNLKVLKYNNKKGQHTDLLDSLIDLQNQVEDERTKIASSQNW